MLHGCLGRLPSPHDRRTVDMSNYLDTSKMTAPPASRIWSRQDGTPTGTPIAVSMFANDRLGDCTCAAIAHHDQVAGAHVGDPSLLTAVDVEQLYRGSGWVPSDPTSDQGWSNLEAAKAAKKAGWIEGFAKFDAGNRMLYEIVINDFGGAYLGIDLPMSAQKQMGAEWDVAPAGKRDSSYDRGSWGGHAATAVDANHRGVLLATWGKYQFATWSFIFTYAAEAMALLVKRWRRNALTPSGIRVDELLADIARLAA